MIFESYSTPYMDGTNEVMSYKTFLYDIEKGSEKDLSNDIWLLENDVEYTTDGYALAKFSNKGGMTYYTIITNNTIIVCYDEPGHVEKYYYKDLSGNNIGIKINGSIKEYN